MKIKRSEAEILATMIFLILFAWIGSTIIPVTHLSYAGTLFLGVVLSFSITLAALIIADAIKATGKQGKKK